MAEIRTILVLPIAHELGEIESLHYVDNRWIAASEQDFERGERISDFKELTSITEDQLYEKIPFLKDRLVDEEGMRIYIDYSSGTININLKHRKKNPFLSDDFARATNQVNLDVSPLVYFKNRKKYVLKIVGIIILSLLIAVFWSSAILIL